MAMVAEQVGQQKIDFTSGAGEVVKGAGDAAALYAAQQKAEATKLELDNMKLKQDSMKSGIFLDYMNKIANSPNPAVQKVLKKQYAAQHQNMYGQPMDPQTLDAISNSPNFGAAMQKLIDDGTVSGMGKDYISAVNKIAESLGLPYVDAEKSVKEALDLMKAEKTSDIKGDVAKLKASIYAGNVAQDNKVAQEKFVQDTMAKIRTDQKSFLEIARYAKDARKAITQPNGINDQKLINAFAKIIDPTSVVREGEFDRVRSYQNLSDQVRNALAKYNLKEGQLLSDKTRKELLSTIDDSLNNSMPGFEAAINEYSDSMDRAGSNGQILRSKFKDILELKKSDVQSGQSTLNDKQLAAVKAYTDAKIPYAQFKAKNPKSAQVIGEAEYNKKLGVK